MVRRIKIEDISAAVTDCLHPDSMSLDIGEAVTRGLVPSHPVRANDGMSWEELEREEAV